MIMKIYFITLFIQDITHNEFTDEEKPLSNQTSAVINLSSGN